MDRILWSTADIWQQPMFRSIMCCCFVSHAVDFASETTTIINLGVPPLRKCVEDSCYNCSTSDMRFIVEKKVLRQPFPKHEANQKRKCKEFLNFYYKSFNQDTHTHTHCMQTRDCMPVGIHPQFYMVSLFFSFYMYRYISMACVFGGHPSSHMRVRITHTHTTPPPSVKRGWLVGWSS